MLVKAITVYCVIGILVIIGSIVWARRYRRLDINDWVSYRRFAFKVFDILECIAIWPLILIGIIIHFVFDICKKLSKNIE